MFYEPKNQNHGLPKNPFNIGDPRPIGWISSIDSDGVFNLALTAFSMLSLRPPTVMFSAGASSTDDRNKDTARNVETTGEFACNLAIWELREQMNFSSPPCLRNGRDCAGRSDARRFHSARRRELPRRRFSLNGSSKTTLIPGWDHGDGYKGYLEKSLVFIDDAMITEGGLIDVVKMPIGRLGYNDYAVDADSIFTMARPDKTASTRLKVRVVSIIGSCRARTADFSFCATYGTIGGSGMITDATHRNVANRVHMRPQ